jgi:hypothetical protein
MDLARVNVSLRFAVGEFWTNNSPFIGCHRALVYNRRVRAAVAKADDTPGVPDARRLRDIARKLCKKFVRFLFPLLNIYLLLNTGVGNVCVDH